MVHRLLILVFSIALLFSCSHFQPFQTEPVRREYKPTEPQVVHIDEAEYEIILEAHYTVSIVPVEDKEEE